MATTAKKPELPKTEETIMIKLPIDRETKEDKVVWVNSRRFLIKRGVPVEVPMCVYEVLEQEEKLLAESYAYEAKVQKAD